MYIDQPPYLVEHLSNFLLEKKFQIGKVNTTIFIKKIEHGILLVQIYVDDIIFSVINKLLCKEFSDMMQNKFEMSTMGEM